VGIPWPQLQPFVLSLRHFAPCVFLVVLVGRPPILEVQAGLHAYGAEQVQVSKSWPYLEGGAVFGDVSLPFLSSVGDLLSTGLSASSSTASEGMGISLLRYFIADVLLGAVDDAFAPPASGARRLVILADSRDVLFQANPFGLAVTPLRRGSSRVWAFEECADRQIRESPWNLKGLEPFDQATLAHLHNKTVINGGIIIGALPAIRQLVTAMRMVIRSVRQEVNDQAILNVLAHVVSPLSTEFEMEVMPHRHGLVRNLGVELSRGVQGDAQSLSDVQLGFDAEGWLQVLGKDRLIAPVVHQYDRFVGLRGAVLERWEGMYEGSQGLPRIHRLLQKFPPRHALDLFRLMLRVASMLE